MKNRFRFFLACAVATAPSALVSGASITLPTETARLIASPLPGYPLATGLCVTCHSVDYIASQPTSSRAYWQAATLKMQKTFGAPIPDTAVAPIVDYLVKTYGAERAVSPAGGATGATTKSAAGK
ncbi:MAG: cytrochrome oxidoreductase subunit [Verrucomicrobiota bacterium]|jgi:sulfite dehydrogenase